MVFRIHMAMKFMLVCFFFVLRLSMLFPGCLCVGSDTILNGRSLFPNQTIISEGGRFELGFFAPGNSRNFYIGIWYKNILLRTVVWVANRNNPISNSLYNSSRLELSNGELFLLANREKTGITGTSNATEAVILDTGNFILRNASGIIWQSFDHPTDTWLPGAPLGFLFFSDIETKLVSWRNHFDPAPGNYSLGIESNGDSELVIKENDNKLWRSGVLQGVAISSVLSNLSNSINFTYVSEGRSVYLVYLAINESVISRIVLTSSGIMQQFVWLEAARRWILYKADPSDACKTYAMCGANAICNIANVPICGCLIGFIPKSVNDWRLQDFSGGCVRRQPMCSEENDFRMVSNIRLPENPESLGFTGPTACQLACRAQCSCNAFAYGTTEGCLLFMEDLLDLESLAYNFAGRDLSVRMDTVSSLNTSRRKGNVKPSLALIVTFSVVAVVVCSVLFFYFRRRQKREVPSSQAAYQNLLLLELSSNGQENNKRPAFRTGSPAEEEHNKYELPAFSFSSIAAATGNFSITNKLGEGGFGPVYKGELLNGQFVAVKRLSKRSGQGLEEFKNETELIAKLQHRNLVGILGCCIENDEKILVYEYMPNKSLDFFLFDPNKKDTLDWTRRVCIIEGIAQGLLYLHHYSRLRIVHRDLKASNILLDAEMNPKISDFGMARIFGGTVLQANTKRIVGTYGYMSPEYAMDGVFSIKSDVYAFGVLMLEIISGRKNTSFYGSDHLNLLGYAWNLWTDNRGLELIDPTLECHSSPSTPLRYIQIGLLCVQENPGDRPTMSDVVAMFNKEQTAVAPPKHPAFILGRSSVHNANPGVNKVDNCSVNDMTVSLMEAR